jgi:membrane-associated phospholipid phosphatase
MERFARFISVLFHPLLMPTYGTALVMYYYSYLVYSLSTAALVIIFGTVFISTFLLPTFISYLLIKKGMVKSFEMDSREERTVPFLATCFCYSIGYYMVSRFMLPPIFSVLLLGAAASVMVATLINFRWKISIHMIGIGGVTGALLCLSQKMAQDIQPAIILSILFAGILGTSRLALHAHTPRQVYYGFLTGVFTGFLVFILY